MLRESPSAAGRPPKTVSLSADLAVVGGGMAGTCCAITAAREGLKVVMIQDRPVLGGNASSEVRLWLLGATTHMGSNNRWAREGGVVNEIMMENLWRNPEGNPLIFDTVVLDLVLAEPNITLLLNTACTEVRKAHADRIAGVSGWCSQNETRYDVEAPLFCDASGDGVVGFLAGAAFRMGAEAKDEFGEKFAPTGEFGHLLGHSIYFYSKDTGKPVTFVPPSFAMRAIEEKIPRFRQFNAKTHGCSLWWIEWGGRLDTVHETETIKWELWRIVYGVWDYIKNSGKFPEAENLTLEWVGHIPGKRESRRFEGDYMLVQQDVVERRTHPDAVAYGGWSIDLHPADGVFAEVAGSHHLHSKGPYQIPYRCYYSRNIENLFLAGRIISASHVAFGSTRVMCTCALGGQAVGTAAALCRENNLRPREVGDSKWMEKLQRRLGRSGHHIPGVAVDDPDNLAATARAVATSSLRLAGLPANGPLRPLEKRIAQMLPLPAGPVPEITISCSTEKDATIRAELRVPGGPWHHTPDTTLASTEARVSAGADISVRIAFDAVLDAPAYAFLCIDAAPGVSIRATETRLTGLMSLTNRHEENTLAVGGDRYDVFTPARRPGGHNLALTLDPPLAVFRPENVLNGWQRPTSQVNAWVADPADPSPALHLEWSQPQRISEITMFFDGDFDHSMESVLWGHPERAVVFCVRHYELLDETGRVLAAGTDNHQSHVVHSLAEPVTTSRLTVRVLATWGAPAAIFEIRCR